MKGYKKEVEIGRWVFKILESIKTQNQPRDKANY